MTFSEIVNWLSKSPGEKAQRSGWARDAYIYQHDDGIKYQFMRNETTYLKVSDIIADDWEPIRPRTGLNFMQAVEWYGKTGIIREGQGREYSVKFNHTRIYRESFDFSIEDILATDWKAFDS